MAHRRQIKPLVDMYDSVEIAEAWTYVEHVFADAPDRYSTTRYNPFTGGNFTRLDPIKPQKEAAARAVLARRWFLKHGSTSGDLLPLPLGYDERETLKAGGAPHILAWYARSLDNLDYDVLEHPSFHDYASGVMASEFAPGSITEDNQLQRWFPARPLSGLGSGLIWLPPKEYDQSPPSTKFETHR